MCEGKTGANGLTLKSYLLSHPGASSSPAGSTHPGQPPDRVDSSGPSAEDEDDEANDANSKHLISQSSLRQPEKEGEDATVNLPRFRALAVLDQGSAPQGWPQKPQTCCAFPITPPLGALLWLQTQVLGGPSSKKDLS